MPGFDSLDDLVQEAFSNGKFQRTYWNKITLPTTNLVAGEWYDLYQATGMPGPGTSSTSFGNGTNCAFQPMIEGSGTVGIPHGGSVLPDSKFVLTASVYSASALTAPAIFMLVDILGYYPIYLLNTNASGASSINLTNINSIPERYSTVVSGTSGEGLRFYIVSSPGSATTPMGAFTPSIQVTYTNSKGVANRVTPGSGSFLPVGKLASPKGHIVYSGIAGVGKYGPFIPLAAGDTGVKSIESINLSTQYNAWPGGASVLNIVICRPILTLALNTVGVAVEKDFLNSFPSLPKVYDDSVLSWLVYAGAATPVNLAYYGHIDFCWG